MQDPIKHKIWYIKRMNTAVPSPAAKNRWHNSRSNSEGMMVELWERLEDIAKELKKWEIPRRKVRFWPRWTYMGRGKHINVVEKEIDANPWLTDHQLKLRLPKSLSNVSPWTITRVILQELDIPSWGGRLFSLLMRPSFYLTSTAGGKIMWRPQGANRFDLKNMVQTVKHPEHILFWGGISTSGKQVYSFLMPREKMNSVSYVSTLHPEVEEDLEVIEAGETHTALKSLLSFRRRKSSQKWSP